jgi:hypothetical protein
MLHQHHQSAAQVATCTVERCGQAADIWLSSASESRRCCEVAWAGPSALEERTTQAFPEVAPASSRMVSSRERSHST